MQIFELFDRGPKIKKEAWMDKKKFILGTVGNLSSIIDHCISSGRYACDLETSGIDNRVYEMPDGTPVTRDQIAGVGLSPDGETGYYIPLRHAMVSSVDGSKTPYECNIPIDVFAKEFKRLTDATEAGKTIAVFHNGKFDHEFLQFNGTGIPWGEWDKAGTWDDTLILCYLRNSRARNKRLKDLSEQPRDMPQDLWANSQCGGPGLGMKMIELYELWGNDKEKPGFRYDFTTLDPTSIEVLWYAASDVICTWLLYPLLSPSVFDNETDGGNQKSVYKIEKSVVTAERWMERCQVHIDLNKVRELIILGHKEWWDAVLDVYHHATIILGRDVMPGKFKILLDGIILDDPTNLLPSQLEAAERRAKPMYGEKPMSIIGKDDKKYSSTYDVVSPLQLGIMFSEMEVPGLKYTEKSGQVMTSREELDRVVEEAGAQFPFMMKVKRFREVNKALSTYLYPLILDVEVDPSVDPDGGLARISFNGRKVDTGRYATAAKENGPRMVGFPKINLQAVPSTAFNPDKPRPECMRRIREAITARPPKKGRSRKYIVAVDYSGEELRLVTNFSRESKWIAEFFRCSGCGRTFSREPRSETSRTPNAPPARCPNCGSDRIGDLHTLTAIEIYGQDAPSRQEWKVLRGNAKGVNFGLCYGGGPHAVQQATGCDRQEGNRVKATFNKTYSELRAWWDVTHKFAKKHAFVRTAFGRKYPLPDINNIDSFFRSKAERNAVNGPIQGTGADIIKIAMALVFKEMKNRGWLDKVMMVATMHDELVFEIDADIIEVAIPLLSDIMTSNDIILGRGWIIPLTCDVELGHDWSVPWDTNKMMYKEVRFHGNKKVKDQSKCPDGVDFESLSSWPEELHQWFSSAGVVSRPSPVQQGDTPAQQNPVVRQPEPTIGMTSAMTMANIAHFGVPVAEDNSSWELRLSAPLTPDTVVKLAQVIVRNRGRGMSQLRIKTMSGVQLDLDSHLSALGIKTPILTSKVDFEAAARQMGLIN